MIGFLCHVFYLISAFEYHFLHKTLVLVAKREHQDQYITKRKSWKIYKNFFQKNNFAQIFFFFFYILHIFFHFTLSLFITILFLHFYVQFIVFPFLLFTFKKKIIFLFFTLEIFITLHLVYFSHSFCSYLYSFIMFLLFFSLHVF